MTNRDDRVELPETIEKMYKQALLLTGEPLNVCDEIVSWIADLLKVEFSCIETIDGRNLNVVTSIQHGKIVRTGQFMLNGSPCEEVQVTKAACSFENVSQQFPQDTFLSENEINYYVGVPICDKDENVKGILNAFGTEQREVSEDDLKILELMAKRASLELEDIRVRQESHEFQRNLLKIGQEILQQQNVDDILGNVADGIQTHSPFNLVAITLYATPIDPSGETLEQIDRVVLGGLSEEDESKLMALVEAGDFIPASEIVSKGMKIGGGYYVNPEQIPDLVRTSVKGASSETGLQDWGPYDDFYIFLEQGDKVIGRISLGDPVGGRLPRENDLEPLNLFVNLASLALDKARRVKQLEGYQSRLEGIYKWNEQLANCETLDEMSAVAMQVMSEMFSYDHVSLFSNEGAVMELIGFATRLPHAEFNLGRFSSIPLGEGLVGKVAITHEPAICSDVSECAEYIEGHPEIQSEMAAPILESGELLGVLNIESTNVDAFGQEDMNLLLALASQLAVIIRAIERREDVEWINHFLQELNQANSLTATLELIIERGIEILAPKADAGSFLLWNENTQLFEFAATVNRNLEQLKNAKISMQGLIPGVFKDNRPVILSNIEQNQNGISASFTDIELPPPASTIALPVREDGELLAVLCLNNLNDEDAFIERDINHVWNLVSEIELALARARDHEKLKKMAIQDALTNTYNRHFFSEYVDDERYTELLQDAPISLVMVDIDDFYQVNDRYGHAIGDRVLQRVAELIRHEVRKLDMVVRYGGDEFIIIMPETTEKQALTVMERLRDKFEEWKPDLPDLNLSISFGVASWDPSGDNSLLDVVEKADQFMYHRRQERVHDRRARKQAIIGTHQRGSGLDP